MDPERGEALHLPFRLERRDDAAMRHALAAFSAQMCTRRSVRHFSREAIPLDVVEAAIATAATAPSGANRQPWTFCLVTDPALKAKIRDAAEAEERAFYGGGAPARWLRDLEPLGTNADKPFLTDAPALIVLFAQRRGALGEQHYYVQESVGIAAGILIAALTVAGLATLTHTPAPMGFLREVLGRPEQERAVLLMPVGFPAADATVPALTRKPLEAVLLRFAAGDTGEGAAAKGPALAATPRGG